MLISCLCPTADRRLYLPLAITCFLRQDWEERDLLILDDGNDAVADLIPNNRRIAYIRLPAPPPTLGEKLNTLVELARAPISIRWDDDDWSDPHRITDQVERLTNSTCQLTGYHSILYWEENTQTAHKYTWTRPSHYALGTSQCFYTAWAKRHPYKNLNRGEDTAFSTEAAQYRQLTSTDAGKLMVARRHGTALTVRTPDNRQYKTVPTTELPEQFLLDLHISHPGYSASPDRATRTSTSVP